MTHTSTLLLISCHSKKTSISGISRSQQKAVKFRAVSRKLETTQLETRKQATDEASALLKKDKLGIPL